MTLPTLRTRIRRHALLTASVAVTAGVLLPTSALAATGAPPPAGAVAAGHWVEVTDAPTGIKVELPGKPKVEKYTKAKDGVEGRVYMAGNDDRATGFAVFDVPRAKDLKVALRAFLGGCNRYSQSPRDVLTGTVTKETDVNGRRTLDARLSAKDGTVGATRFIYDGSHYVQLMSLSTEKQAASMTRTYRQLLDSLRMPTPTAISHAGTRRS
ncbi:hypothetical protein [Streptomyces olivochromogenes]|uniref:hypothetical protein n=1 Tax=Streptomyces olivochromogenes TaxID=1963 RepID=UPI001F36E8FE|nr:hypothetical protein [Streptomyces olivochromogenes]MCF3132853.1 hypothetical protein [Streptomyces olivochromogenes]